MSFIVSVYVIGLVVTILVLGFFPRMRVSPSTLLVSSGKRLSSAETVRDSVPVWSMLSSPTPVSSTLVKPLTCRGWVASWPEPAVAEQAVTTNPTVNKANARRHRMTSLPLHYSRLRHTEAMEDCCGRAGYQTVFSDQFAKRVARTYRKRGLDPTQTRMVSFLIEHGIKGASVLEIGGGVGELQIELLSRGAREATNLEISRNYEAEAAALLAQSG